MTTPSGLRSSWPTVEASWPTAASFSWRMSWACACSSSAIAVRREAVRSSTSAVA